MSQAGIASITKAVPSIPTSFNGDSGTAIPAANTLNVLGGQANYVTGSGSTLTIGWFKWNPVSGTSQQIAIKNAYVTQNSAQTTYILPVTAAIGDSFLLTSDSTATAGYKIAQNAGQSIIMSADVTTVGVLGSLVVANKNTLIVSCVNANTVFIVDFASNRADLTFN